MVKVTRSPMNSSSPDPVLPIVIVSLEGRKPEDGGKGDRPPDLRNWQIEEFLRQTGKADNTQCLMLTLTLYPQHIAMLCQL